MVRQSSKRVTRFGRNDDLLAVAMGRRPKHTCNVSSFLPNGFGRYRHDPKILISFPEFPSRGAVIGGPTPRCFLFLRGSRPLLT